MRCARNICELLISSVPGGSLFLSVCVCVSVFAHSWLLLYTSYRLIQNLCCQLLWRWRVIAKKKKEEVKWKAAVIVMRLRYTATASHSHLGTVMQKRRCFMQTNPADAHQHRVKKWKNKIGFRALCAQTTAASYTLCSFFFNVIHKKIPVKSISSVYIPLRSH